MRNENIVQIADTVDEEVKYGGILFAAPVPFCGIFVYKQHVSVEFSHGAKIEDPYGLLEGKRQRPSSCQITYV